jgi:hypothetical protein
MTTQNRLANLIKADVDAGHEVQWLDIDSKDMANLIDELRNSKSPLAKQMKTVGIDVAMPTLEGVPLHWQAAETKTKLKPARK